MSKKHDSNYDEFGESDYLELPTGLEKVEKTRNRRMELFRNGGTFTNSECIVPDYMTKSTELIAVANNKPESKSKTLKFWKKKSQISKNNAGYYTVDETTSTDKWNFKESLNDIKFPEPTGPVGHAGFVGGNKRKSYEIDELISDVGYEVIDTLSVEPSPVRLPFYVYTTTREDVSYTAAPQMRLNSQDPQEPQEDYMDMEASYKEPSPFLDIPKGKPNPIAKVLPIPEITPPIRRTISHVAVHSHTCSILRKEYHDKVPAPPKRSQSIGNQLEKKKQPPPLTKPRIGSGYDLVPKTQEPKLNHQKHKRETVKILNKEIPVKSETENNTNDIIPSFTPQKARKQISNGVPEKSKTLEKIPPTAPKPGVKRSLSTPHKHRPSTKSCNNENHRTQSPPTPSVKPKHFTETKAKVCEKTSQEQELEKHLKGYNLLNNIEAKSRFKQLNHYHESPSKELAALQI